MTFQVTDVTKPRASVARITEKGNIVQFRRIKKTISLKTKRQIPFERSGDTYMMEVEYFVNSCSASGCPGQESAYVPPKEYRSIL